ncbi:MAG: ATP-binding protein, partial [Actinomycetota bacterium]
MPFEFGVGTTVGRESALEQFDATLDALEAGKSACIALDGEPGIGKTHLLTELTRRAEERGYLVLGGSATEFERDLPFGVWADALDAYVASQELELGESWNTENAQELADILPSLRRS